MKRLVNLMAAVLVLSVLFCTRGVQAAADPIVQIETNMGNIVLRLDERRAPITVANFLQYVRSGFYDGTIFHRVIKGFMIQGGGLTPELREKTAHAPIKNEASVSLRNRKYTIAMARTSAPNSATCQFFINTKDNRGLDPDRAQDGVGYAVFGRVIQGREVVDRIESVDVSNKHPFYKDVPVKPVIIKSVKVLGDSK
ncbi:MAG TPA: peptidyl-prolyl cis-trans isomerase [Candidatus Desulfovibrio intestinipullorum]|uniref:Peptidyl-prolyl cis-trans isomerase n=1 Tax=Candidatus Desulfovibrio intestinipullorum TaxID=2838536 RepID=A0A9D1TRG3_9BACT|nr:peptidyl-prolyl cis-trans isomerase [Candidatus Desulfovibrio intestinipullorum]